MLQHFGGWFGLRPHACVSCACVSCPAGICVWVCVHVCVCVFFLGGGLTDLAGHHLAHLYYPPPLHSLYPPLRSGVQVPAGHPASSWMNWTARQAAQKHTAQWQQWSSCLQVLHTAVAQQIFVATSCCVPGVCVVIAQPCAPLRTLMLMQHPRPLSAGDGGARRGGRAGDAAAAGDTKGSIGAGGRRRQRSVLPLSIPVIATANDAYAPCLRPLRDVAAVYIIRPPGPGRLGPRLAAIAAAEGIALDAQVQRQRRHHM
jgi:hypothetical protein